MELSLTASLGLFALSALIVVVTATSMTKGADVIATQTKLGRLWVGSLLIAGATSLPELVANVTAVRIAQEVGVGVA